MIILVIRHGESEADTDEGEKLQDKALCVPETIAREFHLTPEEAASMYRILYKMLDEERAKNKGRNEK